MITRDVVGSLLWLDAKTGSFYWLKKSTGKSKKDLIAGSKKRNGAVSISIKSKQYLAHNLSWLVHYGKFPESKLIHIDGNKQDNRWSNLRDVSRAINAQNKKPIQINNYSSGLLGVHLHKKSGRYCASIKKNRVKKYLGLFDTPEQAHEAYVAEKRVWHEGCTI